MGNKFYRISVLVIVAMMTFMTGCQSVSTYYQGRTVAEEDLIPLSEVVESGQWSTFDMTINYNYENKGDDLHIGGQVKLSNHYTMNYAYLERLSVYLVFLDNDARVLKTARLANTPSFRINLPMPFSIQLPVPDEATAFSFAYDGSARESGGGKGKGQASHFWHLPKKNAP